MAAPPWCIVVVRAWLEDEGLRARLLTSWPGGEQAVVVTSADAAGQQLVAWLAALAASPAGDAGGDHEATDP
ncbi:MAG: hypothetical protein ACRDZS_00485 [Acidimicrobiales bacterium]